MCVWVVKINTDISMHACVVRYVWSAWYPKCPGVHSLIMQSYSVGAGQVWRKKTCTTLTTRGPPWRAPTK